MAIDTAAKRKSAMNVGLLPLRLGVVPDNGDLSAPQRLHTQGLYSGIAAASPPAASPSAAMRFSWQYRLGWAYAVLAGVLTWMQ